MTRIFIGVPSALIKLFLGFLHESGVHRFCFSFLVVKFLAPIRQQVAARKSRQCRKLPEWTAVWMLNCGHWITELLGNFGAHCRRFRTIFRRSQRQLLFRTFTGVCQHTRSGVEDLFNPQLLTGNSNMATQPEVLISWKIWQIIIVFEIAMVYSPRFANGKKQI